MDKRFLIFLAIAVPIYILSFMYVQYLQQAYAPVKSGAGISGEAGGNQTASTTPGTASQPALVSGDKTSGEAAAPSAPAVQKPVPRPQNVPLETIQTDTYQIQFSSSGAVPVGWFIIDPRFAIVREEKGVKRALSDETEAGSIALIDPGLDPHGLDRPFEVVLRELNARFYNEFNQVTYSVKRSTDETGFQTISFESPVTESGVQMVKSYRFPQNGFESRFTVRLINKGTSKISFNNEGQGLGLALGPGLGTVPNETSGFAIVGKRRRYSFTVPTFSSTKGISAPHVNVSRGGVHQILKSQLQFDVIADPSASIEWGGLHTRYFMMTLRPDEKSSAGKGFTALRSKLDQAVVDTALAVADDATYYPRLELSGAPFSLAPGESAEFAYDVFAGPKEKKILAASQPGLERILFSDSWNWIRALSLFLMSMLSVIHGVLKSWGFSIIVLVIIIRILVLPFVQIGLKQQAKAMAEQARIKPHVDKINEKYKDDPTKKNQEIMKLYREHNVNPLGALKGCVWMIIQLPIWIALYRILNQSIDLRGAGFLWIDDLSQPDRLFSLGFQLPLVGESHFNLLPILYAGTQMLVSKLSMAANPAAAAGNPMQQQMMYMMPVMILFITYSFPSGLVLYWLVSNLWQMGQQRFVNKKILRPPPSA